MKTLTKVGLGCRAVVTLASVGLVLVAPGLVGEAARLAGPIRRLNRSQAALDEMAEKAAWKPPAKDPLSADQLDRFFAVRGRVAEARRHSDPNLDQLPRKHVRTLEELKQVPGVIQGVSAFVGAEMDAFVAAGMPPAEYHWIERLVYLRWRGPLRAPGTYPVAARRRRLRSRPRRRGNRTAACGRGSRPSPRTCASGRRPHPTGSIRRSTPSSCPGSTK
jgi:hypothetical protein